MQIVDSNKDMVTNQTAASHCPIEVTRLPSHVSNRGSLMVVRCLSTYTTDKWNK